MLIAGRGDLKKAKRIVVKVGSSVLLDAKGGFSLSVFDSLADQAVQLRKTHHQWVLVSSGAIAAGMERMGIREKPQQIPRKQALAACGQTSLMHYYEKTFSKRGLRVAQILLDKEDLANRRRYLNARQAVLELWRMGVIPVINENDSVAVDEIQVGDNDNLAALTVNLIEAELLVLLTDVDALYTGDPSKKGSERISIVKSLSRMIHTFAKGTKKAGAVGGMVTKLQAAEKAAHFGAATVIADGTGRRTITEVLHGKVIGTLILPKPAPKRMTTRKHWLAFSISPKGKMIVDAGAVGALKNSSGKSLLPSGVVKVQGTFGRGDCVEIKPERGKVFAKGLAAYSSADLEKIKGCHSGDIEKILGYKYLDEVIHRDDLVLL